MVHFSLIIVKDINVALVFYCTSDYLKGYEQKQLMGYRNARKWNGAKTSERSYKLG